MGSIPRVGEGRRAPGAAVAAVTALVSGVSVFVNSYGVRAIPDAATYTTAKNLVATLLLGLVALAGRRGPRGDDRSGTPQPVEGRSTALAVADDRPGRRWTRLLGLAYVGAIGGGVAFVLFFDGLARSSAGPAAFLHDTLVVWVALLCWALRRERLSPANLAAVALLVVGQTLLGGGVGRLVASDGELLVLGATVLWSVEVVVAKRLLAGTTPERLGLVRMGGGGIVLVAYLALQGHLGTLVALDPAQLGWVVLTGALLAAYVGTWLTALGRARALDVTSVLVASALVTTVLQTVTGHGLLGPQVVGVGLVAGGAIAALVAWPRRAPAGLS
jgi:drug/metabolite transporter (DMT)-like permease